MSDEQTRHPEDDGVMNVPLEYRPIPSEKGILETIQADTAMKLYRACERCPDSQGWIDDIGVCPDCEGSGLIDVEAVLRDWCDTHDDSWGVCENWYGKGVHLQPRDCVKSRRLIMKVGEQR